MGDQKLKSYTDIAADIIAGIPGILREDIHAIVIILENPSEGDNVGVSFCANGNVPLMRKICDQLFEHGYIEQFGTFTDPIGQEVQKDFNAAYPDWQTMTPEQRAKAAEEFEEALMGKLNSTYTQIVDKEIKKMQDIKMPLSEENPERV